MKLHSRHLPLRSWRRISAQLSRCVNAVGAGEGMPATPYNPAASGLTPRFRPPVLSLIRSENACYFPVPAAPARASNRRVAISVTPCHCRTFWNRAPNAAQGNSLLISEGNFGNLRQQAQRGETNETLSFCCVGERDRPSGGRPSRRGPSDAPGVYSGPGGFGECAAGRGVLRIRHQLRRPGHRRHLCR